MGKAKKKSKGKIGSILLIVALLAGSAGLRITVGATKAFANSDAPKAHMPPKADENKEDSANFENMDTSSLLVALQEREKRVASAELKLEMRQKALDVAQHEIERRIEAMKKAEDSLRATLARADTAAEDDVARLTTVYESMKPKDAAALFETMEPTFAAGFLGRMRPDAAAGIMAGLSPEAAYTISVILAGRNAKAPKS